VEFQEELLVVVVKRLLLDPLFRKGLWNAHFELD
jgi:hypothetical protein